MWHSCGVDLRSWIRADLTGVATRFTQAVAGHVPPERWTDRIPGTGSGRASSSIAGMLLHLSYHHDLAVSTATLDRPPLMAGWRDRLGLADAPPELGLSEQEDTTAVDGLELGALVEYFHAVTDLTTAWVTKVSTYALDTVPASSRRLEQRAGVRRSEVPWLHAMWEGRTVGWLVQWEAVAHPYSHLGEMIALRNHLGLSPF